MKGNGTKIIAGLKGMFLLMVFGVMLFWVLGEWLLPGEETAQHGRCQVLEGEWRRVLSNGKSVPVEVPGTCQANRKESVSIEIVLPDKLDADSWLCTFSTWQDIELYVDQILIKRYSAETSRPFGKNSPSAYVFQKLKKEHAGKVLRITTVTDSTYSGVLNTVYIGDRMGIQEFLLKKHGTRLFWELSLLLLSGLSIVFSVVLRRFYRKEILLEYLAWGIFLVSVWLLADSEMRQFLLPNISVTANVAFFAVMLMPFPFLIYMSGVQRQRYRKGYVVLELLMVLNFAVCTFLQETNQRDFMDMRLFLWGMIVLAFLYMIFTLFLDFRRKHIREYRLSVAGILFMFLAAVGEMASISKKQNTSGETILCAGLTLLLAFAMVESVQKLFHMEQEKQRAVLANESKGKFLANMSHEIRTPINTVIGMNEMILRENRDNVIQGYAEHINQASKTLLSLVNDVLDFSKMESGKLELACSPYYLSSLLNDTIHVLKARAQEKHLDVRLNVEEALPSILVGDEVRIRKVLDHLFSNSVKFTEEGSITFSAQGEWNEDGTFCLSFSIADTGIGMKKEDLGRVFDSFTKLEEDKNCTIQGSGLGLNITKRFVEQMEGEIKVSSVYGSGTLFTVRIPQEIEDPEPIGDLQEAYEKEQREYERNREILRAPEAVVLAVDDNEMNLAVVRGLLKRTGISLDTVTGGQECLIYTRKKKYDLIFMDHMMPKPDGIETFHLLREETDNPNAHTKVIALTANAVAGSRNEYLKEGFDDYLSKPIVVEKLEKMLKKHLPEELVSFQEERGKETGSAEQKQERAEGFQEPGMISQEAGLPYCGNDKEMYQEILLAYYEQGRQYMEDLQELYKKGDWEQYGIIAHAIKSTSLTIGAVGVSGQAKQQELAAKEGRLEELKEHFEKFYQDYGKALKEAAQILKIQGQPIESKEIISEDKEDALTESVPYDMPDGIEGNPMGIPYDMTNGTMNLPLGGQKGIEENYGVKMPKESHLSDMDQSIYLEECQILLEQIRGYEMSEAMEQIDKLLSVKPEKILEQVRNAVHDFDYDNAERCLQTWLAEQEVEK